MPARAWKKKSRGDESTEAKRRLVLETAARAFNERGYFKTSLEDIAAELHVTKAALYYYFKNKDEILYECHTLAIEMLLGDPLQDTPGHKATSLEKIEHLVRRYVPMISQSFGRCLVLVGTTPLERESRDKCQAARRRIHDLLIGWIKEGIKEGCIADCDPKTTASLIFGSLNWIAQWFDETGPRSIEKVTEDAVNYVHRSLTPPAQPERKALPRKRVVAPISRAKA